MKRSEQEMEKQQESIHQYQRKKKEKGGKKEKREKREEKPSNEATKQYPKDNQCDAKSSKYNVDIIPFTHELQDLTKRKLYVTLHKFILVRQSLPILDSGSFDGSHSPYSHCSCSLLLLWDISHKNQRILLVFLPAGCRVV